MKRPTVAPSENVSLGMCALRRRKSACIITQNVAFPVYTKTLLVTEYPYSVDAQAHLSIHYEHMLEDTYWF